MGPGGGGGGLSYFLDVRHARLVVDGKHGDSRSDVFRKKIVFLGVRLLEGASSRQYLWSHLTWSHSRLFSPFFEDKGNNTTHKHVGFFLGLIF